MIKLRNGQVVKPVSGAHALISNWLEDDTQSRMRNVIIQAKDGAEACEQARVKTRLDIVPLFPLVVGVVLALIGWSAVR